MRIVLGVVVLIAVVVGAVVVVTRDDDDGGGGGKTSSGEATVKAIPPSPFKAGLAFAEPPSLRSARGRLRGTIVAKNGTITVSGVRVGETQSYGIAGERRGLLGPTLRVDPGDLVDLVLDNRLVQPAVVPSGATPSDPDHLMRGECGHAMNLKSGQSQPTNFHFHGFHVTPRNHKVGDVTYYGDNVLVCLRRGRSHIRFRIPRDHDRGTFWYHAHLHGLTDDQVFRGLAGMIVIGDSRRYLPTRFAHIRQRLLSLKDIQVTSTGDDRWAIPSDHDWANPTHRTVNGLVNPTMTIRPGETQLWRIGNSSSALWYRVALLRGRQRVPITVVGNDGNPLVLPQSKTQVLIEPGHRADVLVRAPSSGSLTLKTLPFNQGRLIFGEDVLATVNITGTPAPDLRSPRRRSRSLPVFPARRGPARTWIFSTYFPKGGDGQFLINGKQFKDTRVDARPRLGTTERWTLYNTSSEWHPIHIHQDDYRVVSINGKRVNVRSDQDVVPLPPIDAKGVPGKVVLDMPFQRYSGDFVMHCHILDHEDAGMMARIDVRP